MQKYVSVFAMNVSNKEALGSSKTKRGARKKPAQAPRLKDIANKLGVSVQTISLVLRGEKGVGPDMSNRVLSEVQRMGYRRNRFASKFFAKKTKTFGVVVPRLAESWISPLVEEIHQSSLAIGFDTEIFLTDYDPKLEEKVLDDLIGMRVDGIILLSRYWRLSDIPSTHYIQTIQNAPQRVPMITNSLILRSHVPTVTQDIYQGMREAVAHLHSRGHTRMALLSPLNEPVDKTGSYRYRVGGFRKGLRDVGLKSENGQLICTVTASSDVIPWNMSRPFLDNYREASIRLVDLLLAQRTRPTGLICSNDAVAAHVIRALMKKGCRVPEDFAVIGCNGTMLAEMGPVPLTTIAFDFKNQARQMITELLSSQHPGYVSPLYRSVATRLVVREST